jgi:hypothetical protein
MLHATVSPRWKVAPRQQTETISNPNAILFHHDSRQHPCMRPCLCYCVSTLESGYTPWYIRLPIMAHPRKGWSSFWLYLLHMVEKETSECCYANKLPVNTASTIPTAILLSQTHLANPPSTTRDVSLRLLLTTGIAMGTMRCVDAVACCSHVHETD